MKKEDIASLIIYLIMIAAAIIVGLTVLQNVIENYPTNFNSFALVILTIIAGLFINVLMLEVCHTIGGLLGGYKVVSFNVLGFCFEKRQGKWKFGFREFDGLTGETKLVPKKEKLDLKPYIWIPLFGYAIEIATAIVLFKAVQNGDISSDANWLAVSSVLLIIVSSLIALYNLTPVKLDSMTDGYRLFLLSNKVNAEAYNELMRIDDLEREGKEIDNIKIFEEITEFTANLNLISVYQHLKNHKYDESEELIDMILADTKKIDPLTRNRLIAQKLFIEVMNKGKDDAKKVYNELANDEIRRFIANDISMESIRSYVLISAFVEESRGEFQIAISKVEKARKRTLPSRLVVENQLYDEALNKVYEAYPEWKKENSAD